MANAEVVKLIMNEGLREKIAEWLGWEFHADGVHWRINPRILGWSVMENLPDFPNDIRACFEHIMPKSPAYNPDIRLIQHIDFDYGECRILDIDGKEYIGRGEEPALAFCRAVEKLIDEST